MKTLNENLNKCSGRNSVALLVQPHSDDILFSASHLLFNSDLDVEVLTIENDPKRAEEDRKLYDFLGIPVHHLNLDYVDNCYYYHFKSRGMKDVSDFNAQVSLNNFFGEEMLSRIRHDALDWIHDFSLTSPDVIIYLPLGIGHPSHLYIRQIVESEFDNVRYYREFPHSYKRRSKKQIEDLSSTHTLEYSVDMSEHHELKWELAGKFYRSQSSLMFFEQGYIKKQLPEEIWYKK